MKELIKRYRAFILTVIINIILIAVYPAVGKNSLRITWSNILEMLAILPSVFILLGLLDVWVDRDIMIKLIGEKSGFVGVAIAFFLGSAAAGPLYAAFPIASVLLKKGGKLSNVLIFIGAWSTTKIPMLLFETSAMGWKFMLTRLSVDLAGIALIAYATERLLTDEEKRFIYENAASMK